MRKSARKVLPVGARTAARTGPGGGLPLSRGTSAVKLDLAVGALRLRSPPPMTDQAAPSSFVAPAFVEAAVAARPHLHVDREAFGRHVATLDSPKLAHAGDLLLAFACASRGEDALRELDLLLRRAVVSAAARIDPSVSFADDVAQLLRERLLLFEPPGILTYAGRAALATWLKMAALRVAMNMRRRREDDAGARVQVTASCSATPADADLAYLRARYRAPFVAALRAALARLPERERRVLHLHLAGGATFEKLAASFGVSTSTIGRWIASARERLASDTRSALRDELRITTSEYDGLAVLVRSDLDVSLSGLLGPPTANR